MFVCFGLCTFHCSPCSLFSQFSIFNSFRGSSKLTFWNCASLFVWNTWEFCQQSIAWHQQIHGTTTLVSLCCCCCCCGFIICWWVFCFLFLCLLIFVCFEMVHCSIFKHSLFLTFHFLFTFCSFVFRIFCLFVTLSHLFWDVAQVCCFRFSLLFMFFFFFFGCLAVLL